MNITLNWLINESSLNNLRCLTSINNMNNPIKNINILDNPDVLKWIKKDEFVLTTGYIFQDNPEFQIKILRELKSIGCSGLGIKIKRFFNSIPENMLKEAEAIDFPIVEIPFYYSFSDISRIVYNELHTKQLKHIETQYSVIDKISDCYFKKLGLDEMIKILSEFLNTPVLAIDSDYNLLSIFITEKYKYILNDSSTLDIELYNDSSYNQNNSTNNTRELYKRFSINYNIFDFHTIMFPNVSGELCILVEDELDSTHISFLNKVINIFALEVEKVISSNKIVHQHHNFFFDYLLSNKELSDSEIINLCNFYGFNYLKKRICVTIILDKTESDYNKNAMIKSLNDFVTNILCSKNESFKCINQNMFCIFIFFNNNIDNFSALNSLYKNVESLKNYLEKNLTCTFKIGISRCHSEINTIDLAFKDSIDSITLNTHLNENEIISSYNTQLIYHTLKKLPKSNLQKIYDDNICKLVEYDKENNSDLMSILKMYYRCKFNSSETSKKLFIHRNTLLNKLDKIKSILNIDLENYDINVSLYLGICSYELLNLL